MKLRINSYTSSNIEKIIDLFGLPNTLDLERIINIDILENCEDIEFLLRHLASYISSNNDDETSLIKNAVITKTKYKLSPNDRINLQINFDEELLRVATRRELQCGLKFVDPKIGEKDPDIFPDDVINKYLPNYQPHPYWWVTKASEVNLTGSNVDEICMQIGLFHLLHDYGKNNADDLFLITYKFTTGKIYKPSVLNRTGPGWWPQNDNGWGKTINAKSYCNGYPTGSNGGVCEALHVFFAPLGDSAHARNISFPNDYIIDWNQYILDRIECLNIQCKRREDDGRTTVI